MRVYGRRENFTAMRAATPAKTTDANPMADTVPSGSPARLAEPIQNSKATATVAKPKIAPHVIASTRLSEALDSC